MKPFPRQEPPLGTDEAALFAAAIEMSPVQRSAFLVSACGPDAKLRTRLEQLLAAHDQPESRLAAGEEASRSTLEISFADQPLTDHDVGHTIGRYKLLEKLGEGGCGVVYVAEQTDPVRRRVALKVIKLGMDTKA